MSKHRSTLFRELLFPIGMLIVLTGVVIRKHGNLASFDLFVIIILAVMLAARLIGWLYKFYNGPTNENADRNVIDDKD